MREIEENQFRNKITMLSFCTMLFIISIHTYNVDVYGLRERTDLLSRMVVLFEDYVNRLEFDFCNNFMFIISGYLFYVSFTWKKLFVKYKSRFWSIGVPYLLWCSFYYFYYCIISRVPMIAAMINGGEAIEFNIINWVRWLTVDSYYVFWFLKKLMLMIICSPVIYVLLKNHFRFPTGLVVLILSFLMQMRYIKFPYMFFDVYYLLGAYIGINHKTIPRIESKRICLSARVILLFLLMYELIGTKLGIPRNEVISVLLICSVWFAFKGELFSQKVKWHYKLSFFIYCIHDFYLEAFEKIFYLILGNHSIWALVDYICMPFFVAMVSILTAAVLKKITPCGLKILTGSRG